MTPPSVLNLDLETLIIFFYSSWRKYENNTFFSALITWDYFSNLFISSKSINYIPRTELSLKWEALHIIDIIYYVYSVFIIDWRIRMSVDDDTQSDLVWGGFITGHQVCGENVFKFMSCLPRCFHSIIRLKTDYQV